jgi:hypothetical protein
LRGLLGLEKFGSLHFYLHNRNRVMTFPIIENAKRQAYLCFSGIAIPCDKSTVDGGSIRSEKILKFNRKAMRESAVEKVEKVDPRYSGGEDTMILKVGKPGSDERKAALAEQYAAILASGEEVSPFGWDGD